MKNSIKNIAIFVVGAALGSVVTWKLLAEINSVREVYRAKLKEGEYESEPMEAAPAPEEKPTESKIYKEMLEALKYAENETEEEGGETMDNKPYVIEPDQFGEFSDYQTLSLTYYADGIIENEYGEILEEDVVDELIGMDSLNHFGEYEDDSVFVRNDELQADYEILLDNNPYPSGLAGE